MNSALSKLTDVPNRFQANQYPNRFQANQYSKLCLIQSNHYEIQNSSLSRVPSVLTALSN
jgi:hypothetical protein